MALIEGFGMVQDPVCHRKLSPNDDKVNEWSDFKESRAEFSQFY